MLIDMEQIILDFQGNQIKRLDKPFTLRDACQEALAASYQDEGNLSGPEKFNRFNLGLKLSAAQVNLTIEEMSKIKELVGKAFGSIVVGRVYNFLETEGPKTVRPGQSAAMKTAAE